MDERYALDCPHCGKVNGYVSDLSSDDDSFESSDDRIESEVFHTASGPVTRVRCPRCGTWIGPDRANPS